MKNRALWVKIRRQCLVIICVIGLLFNIIYMIIHQSIDRFCLINGLISVLLLIIVSTHLSRISLEEELLCEDMYYLKKKNMSDEEIKLYLLGKYGTEVYEKVFKSDSVKKV